MYVVNCKFCNKLIASKEHEYICFDGDGFARSCLWGEDFKKFPVVFSLCEKCNNILKEREYGLKK